MESIVHRSEAALSRWWSSVAATTKAAELIALAYFVYLAVLGLVRPVPLSHRLILLAIPWILCYLWRLETGSSKPWSRVLRQWSSLALILVGYWSVGWFTSPPLESLQAHWLRLDRELLDTIGLRGMLEQFGPLLPFTLETVYLMLYSFPPLALGVVYFCGARRHADRFLTTLFLGVFPAYASLPLFPVHSPRVIFPGQDLPHFNAFPRTLNTWLLDNLDISTSVFPSGHVAVAFSVAFALMTVLPHRRSVWRTAFALAVVVYMATIYGRYHYAVDGLASFVLAATGCWIGSRAGNGESL